MTTSITETSSSEPVPPSSLIVEHRRVIIEFQSPGRLVPWLGPALRGVTAFRYRAAECQQPQDTWQTTWKYCRGCVHNQECGYGQTFEPDAVLHGQIQDAVRPLVISPAFPAPLAASAGAQLPVEFTAIGSQAIAALPALMRAVENAGQHDGLGPDRVGFTVVQPAGLRERRVILASDLPMQAADTPVVKNVTLSLTGPLFLRKRSRGNDGRRVGVPTLRHLMQASIRAARAFLGVHAICPGQVHRDLDALCSTIEPETSAVIPFLQQKASHRSSQRFGVEGVTGWWRFAELPACLMPWLQLGGLLHVGGHRIAGAGGWRLTVASPTGVQSSP
jgi:hypothetical protein